MTTQQANNLALEQEPSVCGHCGCDKWIDAYHIHTIPATHPRNPTPGKPIHTKQKLRGHCMTCHEPFNYDNSVLKSQFKKTREDA